MSPRRKGQGRPSSPPAPREGRPWQDYPTLAVRLWPSPEGLCAEAYVTTLKRGESLRKRQLAYVVWRPPEVTVESLLRWAGRFVEAIERGDYDGKGLAQVKRD